MSASADKNILCLKNSPIKKCVEEDNPAREASFTIGQGNPQTEGYASVFSSAYIFMSTTLPFLTAFFLKVPSY